MRNHKGEHVIIRVTYIQTCLVEEVEAQALLARINLLRQLEASHAILEGDVQHCPSFIR